MPPPLIEVEGRSIEPRSVTAEVAIQTEQWVPRKPSRLSRILGFAKWGERRYGPKYAHAALNVEIDVDEQSGADCALFPYLRLIFEPGEWRGDSFEALAGRRFVEGADAVRFEAFYGNDAPGFDDNRVRFEASPEPGQLLLDWSARFRWRKSDPLETFSFRGPVRIERLWIGLKRDEDLESMIAATMPGFDLETLQPPVITDQTYEAPMRKGRRHWRRFSFPA